MSYTVHEGDCLDVLMAMPDNSVDAVVTDPPYGLGKQPDALAMLRDWLDTGHHDVKGRGFMGKAWDAFVPQPALWREVFRVLKPGGHVLCFAGARTQDLMGLSLRLAGFELRDCVYWVYGSGFPKSLDVSKAIDKAAGAERTVRLSPKPGHAAFVGRDTLAALRNGTLSGEGGFSRPWMHDPQKVEDHHYDFAPATDAARQWQGWGTALKPAVEPCLMARKPLVGTVAENVQRNGTGALNIDGCRIGFAGDADREAAKPQGRATSHGTGSLAGPGAAQDVARSEFVSVQGAGRWPANLVHDGSEEVLALFPQSNGQQGAVTGNEPSSKTNAVYGQFNGRPATRPRGDAGSAARFFYCAKSSKRDRDEGLEGFSARIAGCMNMRNDAHAHATGNTFAPKRNVHPTVKPTDLMRYLCRLITPPDGVILDPFMGSGSTGKAAMLEGFQFIGIEREPEYAAIARARIAHAQSHAASGAEMAPNDDLFATAEAIHG